MKNAVKQRRETADATHLYGDCFAACIASLTGRPLKECDVFDRNMNDEDGLRKTSDLFKSTGWSAAYIPWIANDLPWFSEPCLAIASIIEDRQMHWHAVVVEVSSENGKTEMKLVHDPSTVSTAVLETSLIDNILLVFKTPRQQQEEGKKS